MRCPCPPLQLLCGIEYSVAADRPCQLYWQAAQSLLLFHRACCTCTSERRASVSAAAFSSSLQVQKRIKGLRKHSCLFSPVPWSATGIYEAHPTPEQEDFKTSTSVCASVCEGERERERASKLDLHGPWLQAQRLRLPPDPQLLSSVLGSLALRGGACQYV